MCWSFSQPAITQNLRYAWEFIIVLIWCYPIQLKLPSSEWLQHLNVTHQVLILVSVLFPLSGSFQWPCSPANCLLTFQDPAGAFTKHLPPCLPCLAYCCINWVLSHNWDNLVSLGNHELFDDGTTTLPSLFCSMLGMVDAHFLVGEGKPPGIWCSTSEWWTSMT
jgi:hypothetical protein